MTGVGLGRAFRRHSRVRAAHPARGRASRRRRRYLPRRFPLRRRALLGRCPRRRYLLRRFPPRRAPSLAGARSTGPGPARARGAVTCCAGSRCAAAPSLAGARGAVTCCAGPRARGAVTRCAVPAAPVPAAPAPPPVPVHPAAPDPPPCPAVPDWLLLVASPHPANHESANDMSNPHRVFISPWREGSRYFAGKTVRGHAGGLRMLSG